MTPILGPTVDHVGLYTCGDWETENHSTAALDSILTELGHFIIYREVEGYYLQPRLGQDLKRPRIDRILVPKPHLIEAGWHHGPIGIECKRSGAKVGPAMSQLLDYSRAAWLVEPTKGIWIVVQWLFLWPLEYLHGPLASIQAQHRVGSATPNTSTYNRSVALTLSTGTMPAVGIFHHDGTVHVGPGLNGRKAGSR